MMATVEAVLIRNGNVFSPDELGRVDLLIIAGRVVKIGRGLRLPEGLDGEDYDLDGFFVLPGLVDGHIHIFGGTGEFGPRLVPRPLSAADIVGAGITTVVGVLGYDDVSATLAGVLVRSRVLKAQGISAYMFTGSFRCPGPSLTGSMYQDIILIPEVLGVKVAISEPASSHPDVVTLSRMAGECAAAGLAAGKPGITHVHTGNGPEGLQPLLDLIERSGLSPSQIIPTHVNGSRRRVEQAAAYVKKGGIIDLTATLAPEYGGDRYVKPARAVSSLIANGADPSRVTLSSDSNIIDPVLAMTSGQVLHIVGPDALLTELRAIIRDGSLPMAKSIALATANPARALGLFPHKGVIIPGADADLTVLDQDLNLRRVFARGRLLWSEGKPTSDTLKGTEVII